MSKRDHLGRLDHAVTPFGAEVSTVVLSPSQQYVRLRPTVKQ